MWASRAATLAEVALADAGNRFLSAVCRAISEQTEFPAKSRKIPCWQGIPPSLVARCCYLLLSGSGIPRFQRVGPDLFRRSAGARTREGTAASGRAARRGISRRIGHRG
jgi:hypothetical protein